MGIRGLGGFIKWKLPHVRKSLKWPVPVPSIKTRWAVDCSCLLYRARGSNLSPLTVIASLIVRMRRAQIEPIFIFDGRPPAAKAEVVDQRRCQRQVMHAEMSAISKSLTEHAEDLTSGEKAEMERRHADLQRKAPTVSSGDKDEIKRFLYACGILFVTATGEADDVLAYLCRNGTVQAVVSTDMDMLARGVPLLVLPETNDAAVLTTIRLTDVLSGLQLQYLQFVDACMLMGSDYSSKGWRSVEPRLAVEAARRGVDWSTIDVSGSVCSIMEHGIALLSGNGVTWEQIVSEKQRAKWDAWLLTPASPEIDGVVALVSSNGWPGDWIPLLTGPC